MSKFVVSLVCGANILAFLMAATLVVRTVKLWKKGSNLIARKMLFYFGLAAIFFARVYIDGVDLWLYDSEFLIRFSHNGVMDYESYKLWVEGVYITVTLCGVFLLLTALALQLGVKIRHQAGKSR